MSGDEYKWLVRESSTNCDAGRALRKVLEALADANLQDADHDEGGDEDANADRESAAKTLLFQLATAMTYGHRWHDSDAVADKRQRFPR